MSTNIETVDEYMDAFRQHDHARVLACLTEDVEWEVPGAYHVRGKAAFDNEIENDAFVGRPDIVVTRNIEAHDVVVSEGTVRAEMRDGKRLFLRFCDIFEMRGGKIGKLTSYLMPLQNEAR